MLNAITIRAQNDQSMHSNCTNERRVRLRKREEMGFKMIVEDGESGQQ